MLNEKNPAMILIYSLDGTLIEQHNFALNSGDIAGACYDPEYDCFWIVSDQLKMILAYDRNFNEIARGDLTLSKMEGVAVTDEYIYTVSALNYDLYI